MKVTSLAFFLALLGAAVPSSASCWEEAANQYGIDVDLLKAIGWQESRGWSRIQGPLLKDGNRALGVMQINTVHLPWLARHGITKESLLDACTSIKVGAFILNDCIQKFGFKKHAIGCYYAGPASKAYAAQLEYANSVMKHYYGYKAQSEMAANQFVATAQ